MSYCVHCGVELDQTATRCALCNTPVVDLSALKDENAKSPFPTKKKDKWSASNVPISPSCPQSYLHRPPSPVRYSISLCLQVHFGPFISSVPAFCYGSFLSQLSYIRGCRSICPSSLTALRLPCICGLLHMNTPVIHGI